MILYKNIGFKNSGLLLEFRVLEGLGSSGRLVGRISTYPGTSPTLWHNIVGNKGLLKGFIREYRDVFLILSGIFQGVEGNKRADCCPITYSSYASIWLYNALLCRDRFLIVFC